VSVSAVPLWQPEVVAGLSLGECDRLPLGTLFYGGLVSLALALPLFGFELNLNRVLLALSLGLLVVFMAHQTRHYGMFSPGFLLGLSFIQYNLIIPLEFEIHPALPQTVDLLMPDLSSATMRGAVIATFCGVLGLLLGYAAGIARHGGEEHGYWARPFDARQLRRGAWWLLGVGLIGYFMGITAATGSPFGLYTVSYLERSQLETEVGRLGMGLSFAYAGGMIVVSTGLASLDTSRAGRRNRLLAFAVTAAFAVHSILAGSKSHIFLFGAAALAGWEQRLILRGRTRARLPILLSLTGAIAVVMLAINPMRVGLGLGLSDMARVAVDIFDPQLVNPANVDAPGPYATLLDITNGRVLKGPQYGETYFNALLHMVPGPLAPKSRKPQLHHQYADAMMSQHAGDNEGYAFSHLAEGYLNFGHAGALFQLALLGWIAGASARVLRASRRSLRGIALVAFVGPWLALSARLGWDGLVREVVILMFVPLLVNDWLSVRRASAGRAGA
jgi:hypothetical protein